MGGRGHAVRALPSPAVPDRPRGADGGVAVFPSLYAIPFWELTGKVLASAETALCRARGRLTLGHRVPSGASAASGCSALRAPKLPFLGGDELVSRLK